jgi:hypothetical protein
MARPGSTLWFADDELARCPLRTAHPAVRFYAKSFRHRRAGGRVLEMGDSQRALGSPERRTVARSGVRPRAPFAAGSIGHPPDDSKERLVTRARAAEIRPGLFGVLLHRYTAGSEVAEGRVEFCPRQRYLCSGFRRVMRDAQEVGYRDQAVDPGIQA